MTKKCDNKSVGMLVWRDGTLLLIERKKPPFGFAPPAGHIDGDNSFEESAKRELQEEVDLRAQNIKLLIEGRKENSCRREGGDWHYWKIYQVEAEGEIKRSEDETKQAIFYKKMIYYCLRLKLKNISMAILDKMIGRNRPGLNQFGMSG